MGVAVTAQDGAADHYTAVVYVDGNAGTVRGWDVGSSAYISSAAAYDVTEDLHILIAADGDTGKASAYYRQPGDIGWTALFVNQTVTVIAGGATSTLNVGKWPAAPPKLTSWRSSRSAPPHQSSSRIWWPV